MPELPPQQLLMAFMLLLVGMIGMMTCLIFLELQRIARAIEGKARGDKLSNKS